MASRSRVVPDVAQKLYFMPKPDIFTRGLPSQLPEAYKKFYKEWNAPRAPVHYYPQPGKWRRDPLTGEVWPVQNVPLPIKYPKEVHTGIWGGEGVILGLKKGKHEYAERVAKWWVPVLRRSAVYSEILNKWFSVIVTKRTIALIVKHKGFDNYILETSASDLVSLLALKLKKKMLLTLFDKTLYPDDPEQQEKVYNKYKHYLNSYNKEDLEWYGLSIGEAVHKLQELEDSVQPIPLKYQLRAELIEELKCIAEDEQIELHASKEKKDSKSWLNRMNPFSKNA